MPELSFAWLWKHNTMVADKFTNSYFCRQFAVYIFVLISCHNIRFEWKKAKSKSSWAAPGQPNDPGLFQEILLLPSILLFTLAFLCLFLCCQGRLQNVMIMVLLLAFRLWLVTLFILHNLDIFLVASFLSSIYVLNFLPSVTLPFYECLTCNLWKFWKLHPDSDEF